MEQMILELIVIIDSKIDGETQKVFDTDKYKLLYSDKVSHEYVSRLHSLALYFDESGDNKFFRELVEYVGVLDEEAVKSLCHYREYLLRHQEDTEAVVIMHRALEKQGVIAGEDGSYSTMEEHLKAQAHYTQQYRAQHGVSGMVHYISNRVYINAVERHADRLTELLAYRDERGISLTEVKTDRFDEEDFQSYLSHGPVADGYL